MDGLEIGENGIVSRNALSSKNHASSSGQSGGATPVSGGVNGFGNKLSMSDRLVLLSKIGQGASSVVYKALDLKTMKLVAVKMIEINDR